MVNDKMSKLDRLEEAINDEILAMTPEEVLEEAKADGEDTAAFAQRMDAWLETAFAQAGASRLRGARAALERNQSKTNIVPMKRVLYGIGFLDVTDGKAMSDKLDALRALLARVEAGDHRVGMWRALINPLHPHAPEYARQAFLGSLDAAMALHKAVLTGWHFDVATEANGKGFYASISPKAWGSSFIVCSDSPARAWLIAIIRALIAIEEGKA